MTAAEILTRVRHRLDDSVTPDRWSDGELLNYLNESVEEVCEEARAIRDSATSAVCEVTTVDGTRVYTLHAKILDIILVEYYDTTYKPLKKTTEKELTMNLGPNWKSTEGEPSHYYINDLTELGLYPKPDTEAAGNTVYLTVYRQPLADLGMDDSPEFKAIWHKLLYPGIKAKAYTKTDAETYNPARADAEQKIFEGNIDKVYKQVIALLQADENVSIDEAVF